MKYKRKFKITGMGTLLFLILISVILEYFHPDVGCTLLLLCMPIPMFINFIVRRNETPDKQMPLWVFILFTVVCISSALRH